LQHPEQKTASSFKSGVGCFFYGFCVASSSSCAADDDSSLTADEFDEDDEESLDALSLSFSSASEDS
jgi:hypothetical protein